MLRGPGWMDGIRGTKVKPLSWVAICFPLHQSTRFCWTCRVFLYLLGRIIRCTDFPRYTQPGRLTFPQDTATMLSLISTLLVLTTLFTTLFAAPIPLPLEERQSLSPTRNDLSGSCKAVTVIFARGTSEPGNVGLLAGPPFFNALGSMIGYDKVAVQGVPYPATIAGYLIGGSPEGATSFAGLLGQVVGKCPGTKIVVGGYRYVRMRW